MSQNSKHTPEWEYDGEYSITAPWGNKRVIVAKVVRPAWHEDNHKADLEAARNAKLIIDACNGWPKVTQKNTHLLEALKASQSQLEILLLKIDKDYCFPNRSVWTENDVLIQRATGQEVA